MFLKQKFYFSVRCRCLKHPASCLKGAAAFRYDDGEGFRQIVANFFKDPVYAVGIGIVQEVRLHFISGCSECVRDKLRTQSRATDADAQNTGEAVAFFGFDLSCVDFGSEILDRAKVVLDLSSEFRLRRSLRSPQPVVPDHAVLIGIGDRACLQSIHGLVRLLDLRLHTIEIIIAEAHSAEVERQADGRAYAEIFFISFPERFVVHRFNIAANCRSSPACGETSLIFCNYSGTQSSSSPNAPIGDPGMLKVSGFPPALSVPGRAYKT